MITFKQFLIEAKYAEDKRFTCPDCNGKGAQRVVVQYGEDDYDIDWDPCDTCGTSGKVNRSVYERGKHRDENS